MPSFPNIGNAIGKYLQFVGTMWTLALIGGFITGKRLILCSSQTENFPYAIMSKIQRDIIVVLVLVWFSEGKDVSAGSTEVQRVVRVISW